jgi:LEA14-like dessication related protein
MSSSEDVTVTERGKKSEDTNDRKEGGGGGFIDKVKDFIHDIGEKIEEAVGFGKPTADVSGIHIPHIGLHRADIVVDVLIRNPNPVPIPLVDIDYLIDSDGRKLVSGLIPDAGTIHARGEETVKIPVSLVFDDIKSTYKDIQPGSIIPYLLRVVLLVDVPVIGRIKIPLQKAGEIPIPYKPDVDVEKIKFHRFSLEETTATLHLKLENKNDFDLGLNTLQYEMWLGDDSVVSAELTDSATIEKQGVTTMQVPFSFRPKDFGSAVWDMIRGRGVGYTIRGKIDADTPFGNMKLPISKEGGTTRLRKDDDDEVSQSLLLLLPPRH